MGGCCRGEVADYWRSRRRPCNARSGERMVQPGHRGRDIREGARLRQALRPDGHAADGHAWPAGNNKRGRWRRRRGSSGGRREPGWWRHSWRTGAAAELRIVSRRCGGTPVPLHLEHGLAVRVRAPSVCARLVFDGNWNAETPVTAMTVVAGKGAYSRGPDSPAAARRRRDLPEAPFGADGTPPQQRLPMAMAARCPTVRGTSGTRAAPAGAAPTLRGKHRWDVRRVGCGWPAVGGRLWVRRA